MRWYVFYLFLLFLLGRTLGHLLDYENRQGFEKGYDIGLAFGRALGSGETG